MNSLEQPAISEKQIGQLIEGIKNGATSERVSEEVEKKALQILEIYEDVLDEPMLNRTTDPDLKVRHNNFVQGIARLGLEVDPDDPYGRRVYTTEVMALHYFLVQNPDQLKPKSEEDEDNKTVRVAYLTKYLEKIHTQGKRYEMGDVTVGFEYEYRDPATYQALELSVSDVTKTKHIGLQHLNILDLSFTKPKMAGNIAGFKDESNPQEHKGIIRETVTTPSRSYYTSLREYMYMGLEGYLAIHETYSGIKLDTNHTEVMDVRAILVGAGIITTKQNSRESYVKPSINADGESLYFPYFRARQEKDLIKTGLVTNESYGVEWRSYPMHKTDSWSDFANHARKLHHQWLACNVIHSVQKPEEQRSPEDEDLNNIWNNYTTEWNILLDDYNILPLPNEQRYLPYPKDNNLQRLNAIKNNNEYSDFLDQVIETAEKNPEFKTKCREIITTLNKRTKEVLKK